jgi:molybdate transport system substrate-binding protein
MKKSLLLCMLCALLFTHGCASQTAPRELLIYCGITMYRPMAEIARIIEERESVKVIIIQGGSGSLLRSIEINQVGDLFLPGSEGYIKSAQEKGYVHETALVGYNQAALMVQKGNPLQISADLANLADPQYYVVLGNPESGSIGEETRRILESENLFEPAFANARELSTDSKNLATALIEGRADLVLNWYAVSTWKENAPYMDALPIAEAPVEKLILASLDIAKEPQLAKIFLDYAASKDGLAIFEKYGFAKPPSQK